MLSPEAMLMMLCCESLRKQPWSGNFVALCHVDFPQVASKVCVSLTRSHPVNSFTLWTKIQKRKKNSPALQFVA